MNLRSHSNRSHHIKSCDARARTSPSWIQGNSEAASGETPLDEQAARGWRAPCSSRRRNPRSVEPRCTPTSAPLNFPRMGDNKTTVACPKRLTGNTQRLPTDLHAHRQRYKASKAFATCAALARWNSHNIVFFAFASGCNHAPNLICCLHMCSRRVARRQAATRCASRLIKAPVAPHNNANKSR